MDWYGWAWKLAPALTIAAVLLTAAFVVRARIPGARGRIRRVVLLLFTAGGAGACELACQALGYATAGRGFQIAGELLLAFTVVNLVVATSFEWALPRLGFRTAPIVYELVLVAGWALSAVVVLTLSGFDLAGVAAASTVAVAILTISLQATLGNVVGGVAIQFDRSIEAGDWVILDQGRSGRVREVRWRHTVVETRDGNVLLVPNSSLLSMPLELVGRPGGAPGPFRIAVPFVTDLDTPPEWVIATVETALRAATLANVAPHPPPDCVIEDLGATRHGYVSYAARVWIDDPQPDQQAYTAVALRVHAALRREGIRLAGPAAALYANEQRVATEAERVRRLARTLLDQVELFASLSAADRDALAPHLQDAPYFAGEMLVREGSRARFLYLLAEGTVRIVRTFDGVELEVAQLSGPTFFGEHGLMTGEPRTATVVALTDAPCFRLPRERFDALLRDHPSIGDTLTALVSARRATTEPAQSRDVSDPSGATDPLLVRIRAFFRL